MRINLLLLSSFAALPWTAFAESAGNEATSATATSAAASTACSMPVFLASPPALYICGGKGKLSKPAVLKTTSAESALECGILCKGNAACKTFSYNSAIDQSCNLYSKSLPDQGFAVSMSANAIFWNANCMGCPKASTETASSGTTATSSGATATATNHNRCAQTSFTALSQTYKRYFMGAGLVLNSANPGNDNVNEPAVSTTLTGTFPNDCSAIQACAAQAASRSMIYYSFDVHWLSNTKQWQCVQYYDPTKNTSYYNVPNRMAYVSYGFYNPDY